MKKIVALLLIISFTLSLVACGDSDKIELTLDNYKTYLNVNSTISTIPKEFILSAGAYDYFSYSGFMANVDVEGFNNFNYYDVTLKVKFDVEAIGLYYNEYGGVMREDEEPPSATDECEIIIKTNISGKGSEKQTLYLKTDDLDIYEYFITSEEYLIKFIEVVSISGYVMPAQFK